MTTNTDHIKPGEIAPITGQYQEIGPRGRKGREVSVTQGMPLPPTIVPDSTYVVVQRKTMVHTGSNCPTADHPKKKEC